MPYECHVCGEAFKQMAKLKSHLKLHEEAKTYRCEVCSKLFSKSSNLQSHLRTHTGEKPYQCNLCKKLFPRMNTLRSHVINIHEIPKTEADSHITHVNHTKGQATTEVCTQSSIEKPGLSTTDMLDNSDACIPNSLGDCKPVIVEETDHYSICKETVRLSVDTCASGFSDGDVTKTYFKCKLCSKTMSHKANMEDHVRSHSGIKLFECRLCGKGLSRKQNLVHHLKYVHFIDSVQIDQNIIRKQRSRSCSQKTPVTVYTSKMGTIIDGSNEMGINIEKGIKMETSINESSKMETYIKGSSKLQTSIDESSVSGTSTDDSGKMETSNNGSSKLGTSIEGNSKIETNIEGSSKFGTNIDESSKSGTSIDDSGKIGTSFYGSSNTCIHIEESSKDKEGEKNSCDNEVNNDHQNTCSQNMYSDVQCLPHPYRSSSEDRLSHGDTPTDEITMIRLQNDEINEAEGTENDTSVYFISEESLTNGMEDELNYIVLDPEDQNLKRYKCKLCDFECKRRNYMAEQHQLKHTNYKPYLCVVCCKPYSRKYTLKSHLNKEHNIEGAELEDILETTGGKVSEPIPKSQSKLDKTSMANSSDISIKSGIPAHENMIDFNPNDKAVSNGLTDKSTAVENQVNNDNDNCITEYASSETDEEFSIAFNAMENSSAVSEERGNEALDISMDNTRDNSTEETELFNNTDRDQEEIYMNCDNDADDNDDDDVKPSLNNLDGELPSFFTSVYTMMDKRMPKRKSLIDSDIKQFMDVQNMSCLKCNKKCSNKSNLKQHIKFMHLNRKEFSCLICGKEFHTKFNLKVHWKQHNDLCDKDISERMECQVCGKCFTTKSYLKKHLVNLHGVTDSQTIVCSKS